MKADEFRKELKGRRVAVIGMGRTGLDCARVLVDLGAKVTIGDSKTAEKLRDQCQAAQRMGASLFVGEGYQKALDGAEWVIVSPGVPAEAAILQEAEALGLPVWSEIELAYRLLRGKMLAVTGTNGKTTTCALLREMLRAAGFVAEVAGNISADEMKRTLISASADSTESSVTVAEISSFQMEHVDEFRPDIAILTNISADHLDRYASFSDYMAVKSRIFRRQRESDYSILNRDDPSSRQCESGAGKRLWFSTAPLPKDLNGAYLNKDHIIYKEGDKLTPIGAVSEVRIPGKHNLENVLAATAAAAAFGADAKSIAFAISRFSGVAHRLEWVATVDGVEYVNNSMCTNVQAAIRSLETYERGVILIAGGADRDDDLKPLGPAFRKFARHILLIGECAPKLERIAREVGCERIECLPTLPTAVKRAAEIAKPGDTVLLSPACKSFDMFNDFEERGRVFRESVWSLTANQTR
ncbi:MAG: UDP-N-acetylmuramoyl-L-alanine--D-glutamate ligase [Armatimonadetes bacterium]|nr:UDP-N-acetylmuramoyl-L-alanine--D-glutamate ligase [Armatimonadota bacterium]